MSVSLDALFSFFQQLLGTDPLITEEGDGICFLYSQNEAYVHVGCYPIDVLTSLEPAEAMEMIFTFYREDGNPHNMNQFGDEHIDKILNILSMEALWGRIEIHPVSDDLSVLVHYRCIPLQASDILPVKGDYQLANVTQHLGLMHDEWLRLNNLFTLIAIAPNDFSPEQVDLLLCSYEGRA